MTIRRRRFLTIVAGAGLAAFGPASASATPTQRWRGIALGASASITLAHANAADLIARARDEITRLEKIFSLYDPSSALSRLNTTGRLADPPFELVELLSTCDALNRVTGGAFDPTVQPLWALYAQHAASGATPTPREVEQIRTIVGWRNVGFSQDEIVFSRPNMGLTLNGIAQGYISDKVADLLRAAGVTSVLVDMGEVVAVGLGPDGTPWQVGIADPGERTKRRQTVGLSDQAIATSAPLGTVFDAGGNIGHILDPRTGRPGGVWRQASVTATRATHADGLSTAFCLMDKVDIRKAASDVRVDLISLSGLHTTIS